MVGTQDLHNHVVIGNQPGDGRVTRPGIRERLGAVRSAGVVGQAESDNRRVGVDRQASHFQIGLIRIASQISACDGKGIGSEVQRKVLKAVTPRRVGFGRGDFCTQVTVFEQVDQHLRLGQADQRNRRQNRLENQ